MLDGARACAPDRPAQVVALGPAVARDAPASDTWTRESPVRHHAAVALQLQRQLPAIRQTLRPTTGRGGGGYQVVSHQIAGLRQRVPAAQAGEV